VAVGYAEDVGEGEKLGKGDLVARSEEDFDLEDLELDFFDFFDLDFVFRFLVGRISGFVRFVTLVVVV